MSISRVLLAALLLTFFAVHIAESRPEFEYHRGVETWNGRSLLATIDCNGACAARCRLSSRPNLCKRACGTCCLRCNCVPPGTSGNKEVCPCYDKMTTHGGKPKCP